MQQALWDNFTDEEIIAIDMEIEANITPELMAEFVPIMFNTCSPGELIPMLVGMKAEAPAEFVQMALQAAEQNPPPRSWEKVKAALG